MFEVNVKNVMEGQRNAAQVWGSDHKFGWGGGHSGPAGGINFKKKSKFIFLIFFFGLNVRISCGERGYKIYKNKNKNKSAKN